MKKIFYFLLFLPVIFSFYGISSAEIKKEGIANLKVDNGSISGKLCYPSEFVPVMDIYFENITTKKTIIKHTKNATSSYTFNDIPEGKYFVYAYESDEKPELAVGYTVASKCGLKETCTDHSLLAVVVKAGKKTSKIDLCDWGIKVNSEK